MEQDVQSRLAAAHEALEKRDYNSAGRHCKHVLKQDRSNHDAFIIFGKALMAQKQPVHADMAFRKAIAAKPSSLSAWQGLLELHEGTGDVAKMVEAMEAAMKLAQEAGDDVLLATLISKHAGTRIADTLSQEPAELLSSSVSEPEVNLPQLIQDVVDLKGKGGNDWRQAKLALLEQSMVMISSKPSQLAFEAVLALCEEDNADEMFGDLGLTFVGKDHNARLTWLGSRFQHLYPQHGYALAATAFVMHQRSLSCGLDRGRLISLLQRALRLDSSCVVGWQVMAEAYLFQEVCGAASECVERGLEAIASWRATYGLGLHVAELRLKLILARAAAAAGKYVEADRLFQEVFEGGSAVAHKSIVLLALEGLAKVSIAQGNLEEAWSRLASVVSTDPHSHWTIAEQGWLSYKRRHFGEAVRCLEQAVALCPDVAVYHHRLALAYAGGGVALGFDKSMVLKQLLLAATLDPNKATVFRDLGHHFRASQGASQKAVSCYQKAVNLDADEGEAGEALCDILEERGQVSLAAKTCQTAVERSQRASWAWRRLGYLQVQQKDWSGAVSSLQHALRGYSQDAELWEALGLSYRHLGMLTAALKAYSGVLVLANCSPLFALLESGSILLSLSMFAKAIDMFRAAIEKCRTHVVARCGLAFALLGRARELLKLGAFSWSSALLEEARLIAGDVTASSGHILMGWKLLGDIQITYSEAVPYEAVHINSGHGSGEEAQDRLLGGIASWQKMQLNAGIEAKRAYQHALHLCPSEGSLYMDLGLALKRVRCFRESDVSNFDLRPNPVDVVCGGINLEGGNAEFWTALGVVANEKGLKQHALIQALRIDGDHSLAWALLGQLYLKEGNEGLAKHALDRARGSDPLLSLPWAGMSFIHSSNGRQDKLRDAMADCLYAIHLSPAVDVQLGLAKFAADTKQLHLLQVYVSLEQVIQRAPHSPEAHNLRGLACESKSNFHAAVRAFRMARTVLKSKKMPKSRFSEQNLLISLNLARVLLKAGKISEAIQEYHKIASTGELKREPEGLCSYAIALWWYGEKDLAIATVQQAAECRGDKGCSSAIISLLSKFIYLRSGPSAALREIYQARQVDYSDENFCFTALAVAICSQQSQNVSKLLPLCSKIFSDERASESHVLLTAARQIFNPENGKNVLQPLLKTLHLRPNDAALRAKLSTVILDSSSGHMAELSTRCCPPIMPLLGTAFKNEGIQTLASAALACSSCGTARKVPCFSSRRDCNVRPAISTVLQKWLHKEPWNILPHVYLVTELLQQAQALGYPANLCRAILRMCRTSLSLLATLENTKANNNLKLHLLVCASETALQSGQTSWAIEFARSASEQIPATSSNLFADIQPARCYAALKDENSLKNEVKRLLTSLHHEDVLGWIALAAIQQHYDGTQDISFTFHCLQKAIQTKWKGAAEEKAWLAVLQVVQIQGFLEQGNMALAEKASAKAIAMCPENYVLRLLHGAIALELAKAGAGSELWSSAVRSLAKLSGADGRCSLPVAHALLVQSEAGSSSSHMSNSRVEKLIRAEWSSWPSDRRPAELFFQMGLHAKKSNGASTGSVDGPETLHTAKSWIQHAVHLNPTLQRLQGHSNILA